MLNTFQLLPLMGRQGMPPLLIDPAAQKLQALYASTEWRKFADRSAHETASRVYAKCPPPQRKLAGLEAANYIEAIMPLTQADILEQHSGYGAVRWLWYLRRAPDSLFKGLYGTTLGYDSHLAELLSSQFMASDVSHEAERVAFRVDDASFRHLVRYVGRVKLLSQLHVLYRRVGKGAILDASHPILVSEASEAVERAMRIYDARHDYSHEFIGAGLGLVSVAPDFEKLIDESAIGEPIAFLSLGCAPSFPAPVTYPDGAGGLCVVTAQVRHVINELRLVRLLRPMGEEGGVPEYLSGIAALIQLLVLVPAICVHVPWAFCSIIQHGYVFVGEERLRDIFDHHLAEIVEQLAPLTPGFAWPTNFIEWRESVLDVVPSVWPLSSGNVLRRFRDNFLIDTTSASQALLHRLELARSPLTGNLRGREFELQCQDLIDGTPWAPPPEVKFFRGRRLRQGGVILTDIDAIGVKGRTLLIVSCKSIIYGRDYDQGAFRVIRNIQDTVDNAVVTWERVVAQLRLQPAGENFDFSQFDEIIGVVCTPFAAYSSEERTLAFVQPKLRANSSIRELRDWLACSIATET
ncbi:hypothetical protein CR159_21150 [Pollutimonas subterranea]|uniref:Uncharacterized protein n=1 Tax=Pollutimonas subterranea TaxID=2045210 RepID=A0A2N4TYN8_9BURK|nr:hypothetical protein [Pollutimonas subterranea]PLC47885.1 hypothetical protein CR159_21150 [Pollutimonas subterranea]